MRGQASDKKIERSERSVLAGGVQGPPEASGFLLSRDPYKNGSPAHKL